MHSIISDAFPFSPTGFATSSVHHPWFLLLGVPPFPDVLPHNSSATPTNASLYCLHSPSTVPFSASNSSYFLLTLSLYSTVLALPQLNIIWSHCPLLLPLLHADLKYDRFVLCGDIVSHQRLQSFPIPSCCCRTTGRSSSVLCRPLLWVILWLSFF